MTDLPFDGAITQFFLKKAPKDIRKAIKDAGKDDILTPGYPYAEEMKRKDYDTVMDGLQRQLVRMQANIKRANATLFKISALVIGVEATGDTVFFQDHNLLAEHSKTDSGGKA